MSKRKGMTMKLCPTPHKTNYKLTGDLTTQGKLQVSKRKPGQRLWDIGFGPKLMDTTPKAQISWISPKLKKLLSLFFFHCRTLRE